MKISNFTNDELDYIQFACEVASDVRYRITGSYSLGTAVWQVVDSYSLMKKCRSLTREQFGELCELISGRVIE